MVWISLTFCQWHFGTTPGFCIVPGGLISRSGSTPWTVGGSSHVAQKQIYGLNSQFRRHFFRVPWPLTVHWGPRNHDDGTRTGFCLICFNCMSKFVETNYTRNVCYPFMTYRKSTRGRKKHFADNTTPVYNVKRPTGSLVPGYVYKSSTWWFVSLFWLYWTDWFHSLQTKIVTVFKKVQIVYRLFLVDYYLLHGNI